MSFEAVKKHHKFYNKVKFEFLMGSKLKKVPWSIHCQLHGQLILFKEWCIFIISYATLEVMDTNVLKARNHFLDWNEALVYFEVVHTCDKIGGQIHWDNNNVGCKPG